MSAQAYTPQRVEKQKPTGGQTMMSRTARRLPAIQADRERTDASQQNAQGLIITDTTAFLAPSKSKARKLPMIPEGVITTNNIYGDQIYPSGQGSKGRGLKQVMLDGRLNSVLNSDMRVSYRTIGIKGNMLYAFVWQKDDYGEIGKAWFRSLNLWTMDYTDVDMSEHFEDEFIQSGVYVPEENAFYGFGYNCWLRFDVASMKATILASPVSSAYNPQITYNTKKRMIVGVTSTGEFYSYAKEDGSQTLLKSTDVTSPYTAGLCYDALSNHYIWCPNTDSASELIAFNADTFEAFKICDIENTAQLGVLYCNEAKKKDPQAPRAAEFVSSEFPGGACTGEVVFKLPEYCNDDTPIQSAMDYKLFIEGIEYASGKGNPGENVTFKIGEDANLTDGPFVFNLVCLLDDHESLDNNVTVYVGNDIPAKPENVKLTIDKITWDPVMASAHGGYLDTESVRYNVELNGTVIAENLSSTSCATGLAANAELASYVATVYATAKGHTSEGGSSNELQFGQAFNEPALFHPTQAQVKLFTIEDTNNDKSTWAYHANTEAFRHKYSFINDADDWLFLPPVNIKETGFLHTFSLNAWAVDEEIFEVYVGNQPSSEAMTHKIMGPCSTPGNEVKTEYESLFDITEPGIYYIGIHAITPSDRLFLYVQDMKVEVSPVSKNGPDAVTDVTATPGDQGALTATIDFKLPLNTINGQPLTGTVTAVVSNADDSISVSGKPGSSQSVLLYTAQGDNHVTIQTFQDETHGMLYEFDVYTGVDIPGMPKNLTSVLNEDNISGTLTWEAPETGQNGRFIRQTGITYYLCREKSTLFGTTEWVPVQEIGEDVFEFKFNVDGSTPLQSMGLGIVAENEAGAGNMIAVTNFIIGVPHTLPLAETFQNPKSPDYGPIFLSSTGESKVNWSISNPADKGEQYATADNGAIVGTTATKTSGCVTLPKFSTIGMQEAGFIPTFYLGSCENIRITASASGVEETEILDLDGIFGWDASEGYRQVTVKLPEAFQNRGWVEIKIYPEFSPEHSLFIMDGYRTKNLIHLDLSVQMAGNIRGSVGEPMALNANVTNIGISECRFPGGKFTLFDNDGIVIAEHTVEPQANIAADESVQINWNYVPSTSNLGNGTVRFELTGSDMNEANDNDEAPFEVIKGKSILIDDLTAKASADGISLRWSEPEVRNGAESFEDYIPFVPVNDRIGEFTQVFDESIDTYAISGSDEFQQVLKDIMYKPGFQVYNSMTMDRLLGRGAIPHAIDGEQLLIAYCPGQQADGDIPSADYWLISPLVKPGTDFSMSACPLINKYGMEQVEICYTTEDSVDPATFQLLERVELGNTDTSVPVEWQDISFTLPEDAKRFAIRYVSRDVFGICIDNIRYIPVNGEVSVTGYEIYRAQEGNGEFSRLGEAANCEYSDNTAALDTDYSYYVLPQLSDGNHGLESNIVDVKISGIADVDADRFIAGGRNEIIICGYNGLEADICTPDGITAARALCSDVTRISVRPGIYIVNVDGTAVKVNVR